MTEEHQVHVVTGAFGYTGKYIARRLLEKGCSVRTLTNSTHRRNPFGDRIEVHPFNFDEPDKLAESLKGASVLYNTYWIRFSYRDMTFEAALKNTATIFDCAKKAGFVQVFD